MEIFSTTEFDRDFKKAGKEDITRINGIIEQLKNSNLIGKQPHHVKDIYSIRIGNKRLIYRKEGLRVTLLFFKSREGVYDYLR